eukprot:TRINITY_DN1688_c0_g1_i1.p1 TRINITY_DN1688_c0_g1~~TRINITY_DN1688_c0_g1_i1.p1  ORF type:complete len:535 (-),score=141.11 TRINITY_DN1688_c0_g1_i1:179-1783(-)
MRRTMLQSLLRSAVRVAKTAPSRAFKSSRPTRAGESFAAEASKALNRSKARSKHSTMLITLTGDDRPGITAAFSSILHESGCTLIDANQATIHGKLCLYFLLSMGPEHQKPLLSDLLWKSNEFPQLDVKFEVISDNDLEEQSANTDFDEHVITLIGKKVSFGAVAAVTEHVAEKGFNVVTINQLSDTSPSSLLWREIDSQGEGLVPKGDVQGLPGSVELFSNQNEVVEKKEWDEWAKGSHLGNRELTRALEMKIRPTSRTGKSDADALQRSLLQLQQELGCDVALQREATLRRVKRLVVMDMDSTLIQQEVIDEIARAHGVYDKVSEVTETAMQGGMDFNESLRVRCKELKGCPASVLDDVYENIKLTPGAKPFIQELQRQGYKIGVLSGGFNAITQRVAADLNLDFAFANDLEVVDGVLTGEVVGAIVNRERKRDLLESICQSMRISTEQAIAVGDGANDLEMLSAAGLGIAFNAKPKVQQASKYTINTNRLDSILYLLGVRASDMKSPDGLGSSASSVLNFTQKRTRQSRAV